MTSLITRNEMRHLRAAQDAPGAPTDPTGATKPASIDELVRATVAEIRQDLLRFLVRRLRNRDEASDVLQRFHAKVLAGISDLRETEKLRLWVRRVFEAALVDHYREQGRRRRTEIALGPSEQPQIEGEGKDHLDTAVCMCLYKLLPTLKREYADILLRVDLRGKERGETTAADLGLTGSNFRVRLHRARQALKRRLEESSRPCPIHRFLDCACDYAGKVRAGNERRRKSVQSVTKSRAAHHRQRHAPLEQTSRGHGTARE